MRKYNVQILTETVKQRGDFDTYMDEWKHTQSKNTHEERPNSIVQNHDQNLGCRPDQIHGNPRVHTSFALSHQTLNS